MLILCPFKADLGLLSAKGLRRGVPSKPLSCLNSYIIKSHLIYNPVVLISVLSEFFFVFSSFMVTSPNSKI